MVLADFVIGTGAAIFASGFLIYTGCMTVEIKNPDVRVTNFINKGSELMKRSYNNILMPFLKNDFVQVCVLIPLSMNLFIISFFGPILGVVYLLDRSGRC